MKIIKTDLQKRKLIQALESKSSKEKNAFWKALAKEIAKPERVKKPVNVFKLEKLFSGKLLVCPNKVLGKGTLSKAIEVAALSFSKEAKEKILAKKGKCILLFDLVKSQARPKDMIIVK